MTLGEALPLSRLLSPQPPDGLVPSGSEILGLSAAQPMPGLARSRRCARAFPQVLWTLWPCGPLI